MTDIPNIKGRLPAGESARDLVGRYWSAHGLTPGRNPTHDAEGTVTFSWRVNQETQRVDEWLVSVSESADTPYRLQTPGEYLAEYGTVDAESDELDPIREKGIGSGKVDFEEGDPNPNGEGTFWSEGTQSFQRPFVQLEARL